MKLLFLQVPTIHPPSSKKREKVFLFFFFLSLSFLWMRKRSDERERRRAETQRDWTSRCSDPYLWTLKPFHQDSGLYRLHTCCPSRKAQKEREREREKQKKTFKLEPRNSPCVFFSLPPLQFTTPSPFVEGRKKSFTWPVFVIHGGLHQSRRAFCNISKLFAPRLQRRRLCVGLRSEI